jgi:hypothetical protein
MLSDDKLLCTVAAPALSEMARKLILGSIFFLCVAANAANVCESEYLFVC